MNSSSRIDEREKERDFYYFLLGVNGRKECKRRVKGIYVCWFKDKMGFLLLVIADEWQKGVGKKSKGGDGCCRIS